MTIRRRIGLLVPATNSTGEPDFHMTPPDGVTVHSHHVWNSTDASSDQAMDLMNSDLANGSRHLAPLGIEVICMAGTANSFYKGIQGSDWMEQVMSRAANVWTAAAPLPPLKINRHAFMNELPKCKKTPGRRGGR